MSEQIPEVAAADVAPSAIEEARRVLDEDVKQRQEQAAQLFLQFQSELKSLGLTLIVSCNAVMNEKAQFVMTFKPQ